MSTTTMMVLAGVVVLGIAIWKGRKVLISKNANGDYELEISKLNDKIKKLNSTISKNYKIISNQEKVLDELNTHLENMNNSIHTKGMNMKKLRAIIKKTK